MNDKYYYMSEDSSDRTSLLNIDTIPFQRTRVYYRNPFMHIGHLNTLYHNDNIAKQYGGVCYALIDDRPDDDRITSLQEDFEYLGLKHIKVVSVFEHRDEIMSYTEELIRKGDIYLHYCSSIETNSDRIIQHLKAPKMHFQLKLRCGDRPNQYKDPSIGYTKDYAIGLSVMLIFDYIIKVLDTKLDITDIISTSTAEVSDVRDPNISNFFDRCSARKIAYHRLDTYFIHGFKYAKKNWPRMNERDPYLLTIKGLKARHIPPIILYAFYLHATQMVSVKITYLNTLLRSHLYRTTDRVQGVVRPLEVVITNWAPKLTEYTCKSVNPVRDSEMSLCPLSDKFYIDHMDHGMDPQKWTKGRYCRLKYGPVVKCNEVEIGEHGPVKLYAEVQNGYRDYGKIRTVHWVSSEWGQGPVKVLFYLYNWFYTGQNTIMDPRVSEGYIDRLVFSDLSQIYQIERNGYYIYDAHLSILNSIPTFICICKIKN